MFRARLAFFRRPLGCLFGSVLSIGLCLFTLVAFFIVRDQIVYRDVIRTRMEAGARTTSRQERPILSPDADSGARPSSPASPAASAPTLGDANRGRQLFAANPCPACHSLTSGEDKVGPSLYGIGQRAATRKPGLSAQAYLHESIVDPNAFVVPGFSPGLMPASFGKQLSEQDIADLIAFMQHDLGGQ